MPEHVKLLLMLLIPARTLVGVALTLAKLVTTAEEFLVLTADPDTVVDTDMALAPTRLLAIADATVKLAVIPSGSMVWMPPILGAATTVNALAIVLAPECSLPPFTATLTVDVKVAVPLVGGITSADAETATDDSSAALVVLCILVGAAETVLTAVIVAPVVFSYPPMVNTLKLLATALDPVRKCPPLG